MITYNDDFSWSIAEIERESIKLKKAVLNVLTNSTEPLKISEILDSSDILYKLSFQKMTHLLDLLIADGKVRKIVNKKECRYTLIK